MLYIIRFAAQDVVHFRRTISVRTEIRCSDGKIRVIAMKDAGFGERTGMIPLINAGCFDTQSPVSTDSQVSTET
jgi:hypothetical protein